MQKLKGIANISSPLNFKPDHLFEIGKRENNSKRDFLFINKLLGKHIEVSPTVVRATGHLLTGLKYNDQTKNTDAKDIYILAEYLKNQSRNVKKDEKYFDNKAKYIVQHHKYYFDVNSKISKISKNPNNQNKQNKKVLVIGFAETATALGMSVAASIKNSDYQSTTREDFAEITYQEHKSNISKTVEINKRFTFEEEHSHATTHNLYNAYLNRAGEIVCNKNTNFEKYSEIILVDDEISTGKTICNIIKELYKETKIKKYSVLSIMDWRNDFYKKQSYQLEKENDLSIKYYSLMSGELVFFDEYNKEEQNKVTIETNKSIKNIKNSKETKKTRENKKNKEAKLEIRKIVKNKNVLNTYKKKKKHKSKDIILSDFSIPLIINHSNNNDDKDNKNNKNKKNIENLKKVKINNFDKIYLKSGRFLLSSKQINDIDQEINNLMKNQSVLNEIEMMIKNIDYKKYYEIKNTTIPKLKESTTLYGHAMDRIIYNLQTLINNHPFDEKLKNKNETKILVISEGEDMYIPSRIAFYLEDNGYNVKFKTTTRSPIAIDGKTIKEKESYFATNLFNPYTEDANNKKYYFYNKQQCAENYDLVLFILEKSATFPIDKDNFRIMYID